MGPRAPSSHTANEPERVGMGAPVTHTISDLFVRSRLVSMNVLLRFGVAAVWVIVIVLVFSLRGQVPKTESFASDNLAPHSSRPVEEQQGKEEQNVTTSPFTGAFARFPAISSLEPRQKRLTLVGVWNDDYFAPYLRHFYYTVQKNADSVDALIINRIKTPGKSCIDFAAENVDITWGGNVKVVCLQEDEWRRHLTDFLCSEEYGWNCNASQREGVVQQWGYRGDPRNYDWRPFLEPAFRSHFLHPENPYWAWTDQDNFIGDFRRYPFNVLSQVSLVTGREQLPSMYMAGQLTAMNFEDAGLMRAWKKFVGLRSPEDFASAPDGHFPNSPEEQYWSQGYLRSDPDSPGSELSFVIYPDLHGDDFFDGHWDKKNASQMHVMSGRQLLLVDQTFTSEDIERLIQLERDTPVDDLGGIGWTAGEDGSAGLLQDPTLEPEQAKAAAVKLATARTGAPAHVHNGILDVQKIGIVPDCPVEPTVNFVHQCVPMHPLAKSKPIVFRESLVRFKEQKAMDIFRRLERDDRPRGYERKLIRHHGRTLGHTNQWFELPKFDITDDMVLVCNNDFVKVWRMGPGRNETIFFRADQQTPIG